MGKLWRDFGRFCILLGMWIFILRLWQCSTVISWEDRLFQPKVMYREVYISDTFTSVQVEDIVEGLQQWEEKTHGAVQFYLNYSFNGHMDTLLALREKSLVFLDISPDDPNIQALDQIQQENHHVPGWTFITEGYYDAAQPVPTIYLVSERIYNQIEFTTIVMHEVGHSFGLAHNPKEDTLMYESTTHASTYITPDDLAAFCQLHYCDATVKTK